MASVKFDNTITDASLTNFRAISGAAGGPARSNRFILQVLGGPPTLSLGVRNDLSFLCEAVEYPGRGFMSTDIRYYGPNFKVPYQSVYEDLNLTFICRDEFLEREFFDNWMNIINPINSYNFEYRDKYISTIRLHQFSEYAHEAKYSFTFDRAFPILVNPQPATWADDNFHRLTVSFTYFRWRRENLDPVVADFLWSESNLVPGVSNRADQQGTRPDNTGYLTGGSF